jgi:hypothetical protein
VVVFLVVVVVAAVGEGEAACWEAVGVPPLSNWLRGADARGP